MGKNGKSKLPLLPTTSVPTRVIVSIEDAITSPTYCPADGRTNPKCPNQRISAEGYMTNLKQPAIFNHKLPDFRANL